MNKRTRILIVEDLVADADLAKYAIRKVLKDCEFQVVETRKDFLKALEVFQPDVILSDYSLPSFDGMKALRLALKYAPLTPLVIWTGSISEDVAVECMKAGASNYVLKENIKRLVPAVIHALEERQVLLERKQVEETLQNNEKRFRALIENGLDNISLLAADGTLIWESPATIRTLDYAPDEFIGRDIFELIHPDDQEWTRNLYAKLIQEPGSRERGTFRLHHSDGTWHWVEAIVTNMLNEPSVNAIVVNSRDITERKQAEEMLKEERNLLRTLIDNLPDRIYAMDIHGRKTLSNTADWKASGGKTMKDVIGKTDFDIYPPELAKQLWELDKAILDSGQPVINYEEPGFDDKGNPASILKTRIPLRDDEGKVIGLVGIGRDITERKRAEEALRESENRLVTALSGAQISVWEWDLQTNSILWSPEFSEITGVRADSFDKTFESFTHLVHPEDLTRVMTAAERAVADDSLFAEEFRVIRPDGEIHWISNLGHAEHDSTNSHLRLIGTVQDITRRKQAEMESQALLEIMQGLANTKDLQELLKLVHRSIAKVIYAENFFVVLYQRNNGVFEEIYSVDQYDPPASPSKLEKSITSHVFRSGEPLLLTQALFDELVAQGQVELVGTNSEAWLGVPLKASGNIIGVMVVQDYENPNRYSEHDKDFLASIAAQIALAIERRQAEDALHKSEELYRQAIEVAGAVPYYESYYDEGRLIKYEFIGEGIRQITGYGPEEFSATLWDSLVEEIHLVEDLAGYSLDEGIRRVRTGENSIWKCEHRIRARDGSIHWVFEAAVELRDENGVSHGSIGTYQDITTRKQAEDALRDAEIKYRTLVERLPVVIYTSELGANGMWSYVGPQIEQLLGFTPQEWMADPGLWYRQLHPDDREQQELMEELAYQRGESFVGEYRIFARDGRQLWIRDSAHILPSRNDSAPIVQGVLMDITERKRAEDELRASEERFRQLADNIEEVFWMTDAESNNEIYMSPAAEVIWERPIKSLKSEPNAFINSVFPEDQPALLHAIEKEKNGEKVEIEYRILRPDGSVRWVWDRAFPIFDDSGKVRRIAGITADITVRRESEMALVKSQGRYRELFDSSPISIWEEDYSLVKKRIDLLLESGVTNLKEYFSIHPNEVAELASLVIVTDINKVSLELYQVKHKEDLLDSLTKVMGSEPLSHFEEEIHGLMGPLKRFTWEGADKTINGRQMEVIVNGSIPDGYEEDWSKVIISINDITERRQAEQQLRKLSRAVEQSASTIVITDTAGNIEYVNPKFTEVTGYTFEEAIGQNPRILKSGFTSDEEYKQLWQTISSGREWYGELLNRKKNGQLFWEYVTISPILNEHQEITHFVGVKEDITQRKQSEAETQRHLTELEALYENGLAVGRLLKTNEIGNRVINTFARYLQWKHVTIRLRKEESDDLELVAINLPSSKDEEGTETEQHFAALINKVGQGLSGWVIQTGVPLRTGNVHTYPQYIDTYAGIQSGLYMPLKIGEDVIGVISVESEEPDAFSEQDERLLATLANQAVIAFENARLYEAIQKELLERKRAERDLRSSEVHYRQLADSITDVLFEIDQERRLTHWNKASETLTRIQAKDAIGKSMQDIFGGTEEQSKMGQIYEEVLKNRQPRTFEATIPLNGQKRSFEINAYPSTRGVSVVAKDVTERKQSEIIMQKRFELMEFSSHHSLDELMQKTTDEISELTGSSIGFFNFVEDDQITLGLQTWSTNALQLFHIPVSKGTHLPLDQAGIWAEAARQRRPLIQNDYGSLSKRKGLPEGHILITREMVVPIIRNERIMAIMGAANKPQDYTQYDLEIAERLADYAWDITERKQMEMALEVERNQLAQRVDERTADLSRANSNLARALRVKDEFLANMSHELRTPLNAILGLSESLGEQTAGPLNEKQQKYIATIGESGHHLLSLINDILDLAKIDAGQITLDINKVDIHSVCQASLRMIKQLAQKKNQEVSLQIENGLGLIWADERRLKQMIVNLLGNAVKFTPENGKIGLEVHGDEEANKIGFTVWDEGIGIKQEDLTRLFQPFVQLDSGLARETTGTGLGLALVAQMVRLHGGSIRVDSQPESGSRFTIFLPWEPALTMDAATRMKITGKFRAIKLDEKNKLTILLVEDTKEVTMMIQDYLELAGYKVVTAQDGVDAIVQAKLVRPDLILMDVQMPRMDGLEAARRLRSEPDFRYTPIIALTALAMSGDRERCLEAGMDEYLSKPVNLKALVKIIQGCLFSNQETKSQ